MNYSVIHQYSKIFELFGDPLIINTNILTLKILPESSQLSPMSQPQPGFSKFENKNVLNTKRNFEFLKNVNGNLLNAELIEQYVRNPNSTKLNQPEIISEAKFVVDSNSEF